jgi:hypothetical protein
MYRLDNELSNIQIQNGCESETIKTKMSVTSSKIFVCNGALDPETEKSWDASIQHSHTLFTSAPDL